MEEIKINKNNRSLTFINNGIGFSQFGVAREILDLIEKLQKEIEYLDDYNRSLHNENKRLNNIINELEKHLQNEIHEGRSEDNVWLMGCYDEDREILDKLQELKGSDK